ncbi:hypothetical protein DRJ23_01435 [Candidatus Acetothermia bacterium]|nr:MAG: hypothetical protein DRJ23_01435 [Candidatus Acetothermia bacterium]
MKALAESRVAIVGLGLMGGSLAGALRGKCRAVVGVTRQDETLTEAHPHPEAALSDGAQTVEPARFAAKKLERRTVAKAAGRTL